MDQQQPQWSPPPQQPMGWGGPGYGGPPPRPTGVTLAAIYLIVMGILLGLFGGCSAFVGGGISGINAPGAGVAGGSFVVFGVIVLIVAIAGIAAGAGALNGAGWARWTGVIVSIVMIVVLALLALAFLGAQNGTGFGVGFITIAVLYGLTAYALVAAGPYFARR